MSSDPVQAIADRLERTLGRMLELYELGDGDRQELVQRVEECVENVGAISLAVQVFQVDCETRIDALANEVKECVRRLDHVHGQALRALTDRIQPKGRA